ncbi:hypothetical protein BRARA_D00139 [Brassica rapa]|uniref:Uncharacterized protein n=1 Tax=Brassica campestris TaxID=3711 RepID=A0A397ZQL1_BRACM|nr:hypothetical protein BRARA_D00139 [Brassica rapa]
MIKLVWSPETAYIHTIRTAGWNTRLIVKTWIHGDPIETTVGLIVNSSWPSTPAR